MNRDRVKLSLAAGQNVGVVQYHQQTHETIGDLSLVGREVAEIGYQNLIQVKFK